MNLDDQLLDKLSEIVDLAKNHYKLEFCKSPLTKNVLTVLGDQSSGKSSFINYLFGFPVRTSGPNAIDTQFTILETVPESEFKELCQLYNPKVQISKEDLNKPLERSKTDPRKNVVWYELTQLQKMYRYRQFYESNLSELFNK